MILLCWMRKPVGAKVKNDIDPESQRNQIDLRNAYSESGSKDGPKPENNCLKVMTWSSVAVIMK